MDGVPRRVTDGDREESQADNRLQAETAHARRRQKAAAYLRAAKLTDDPAERESLRRRAAELLSPRHGASQ